MCCWSRLCFDVNTHTRLFWAAGDCCCNAAEGAEQMKKNGGGWKPMLSFLELQHLAENMIFRTLDIILTLSNIVERENML